MMMLTNVISIFLCVTGGDGGRHGSLRCLLSLLTLLLHAVVSIAGAEDYPHFSLSSAIVNITYHDPIRDALISQVDEYGRYGSSSRQVAEFGYVMHVKTLLSDTPPFGCIIPPTSLPTERWIALVEKGACKLPKLLNAAALKNASAIVIYSNDDDAETEVQSRKHKADDMVHIFVSAQFGELVGSLLDNGTRVFMHIAVGYKHPTYYSTINKTSMLFLSISFIVLMIISLAWLVFYYVQRSRYTYAKQRLSRRLMCAAKKAISKMPLRTVRSGDEDIDTGFDLCAVCIEGYRSCDVVRILPCKHVFHKSCIDPWLIEHRSCPICKIDILKAYGLQVYRSRESMLNVEPDVVSTSFGYSEFISPDAGGIGRDFDSDGVEIVRFQLAHIEYHSSAAAAAADDDEVDAPPAAADDLPETTTAAVKPSCSSMSEAQATIEACHRPSDNNGLVDDGNNGCGDGGGTASQHRHSTAAQSDLMRPPSVHSAKSEESESNEMQSLMTGKLRSTSC